MPQAGAQAWWAEVEDVKERIERRRARDRAASRSGSRGDRRTVNISGRPERSTVALRLVAAEERQRSHISARCARRRPGVLERISARPDRLAGWAVLLGFTVVLVTLLSTHG